MRKPLLDDIKKIEKLDNSDMHDLLVSFSKAIQDAHAIGSHMKLPPEYKKKYNAIVFTGLGGSAIGADFIKSYLEDEIDIPIIVNRDYTIPAVVNKNVLFITSSYSGNTEETLSAYKLAKKAGVNIVVLSSNGKLMEMAIKDGFPFVRIPGKLPPRAALAYGTIPYLSLFAELGLISSRADEIKEAIKVIAEMREELKISVTRKRNIAKKIAESLRDKFPIIYGASRHISVVATRWRGQLAENSKTISSSHLLPEMNHNEIVGWENPKALLAKFIVLLLKDKDDHPRVKTRMEITKAIIKKKKAHIIEVTSKGKGLLARLFSLIYIGDWVSFYLAILNGVDPTPVDLITYLKKKLSE